MRGAGAMSRDTVEQIIGRFGSQQRVAELLGIWQTAVSGWVRRGAIPASRQGPVRDWRDSPARRRTQEHVRLGDPARAPRRTEHRHAAGNGADAAPGQRRGAGHGDGGGIVWAVGSKVRRWQVGDQVVVHCNQDDGDDEECNGGDPMLSPSQRIWGYETPDGSFAQFCRVQSRQLMPRPKHLTWEESGCYVLTLATAYRMLFGHAPHTLRPGHNVLVWGGAGGLGSMAIQVIAASGANAIAVISDEDKRDFVLSLGARGVINRKDFDCWGQLPDIDDAASFGAYMKKVREFGKAIWETTGKGNDVDIVFEHPGEVTFPVSVFVVKRGGMVVICAGTTGYNLTMDARYLWMHQKRVQGSHFANLMQASQANRLVIARRIDPCMSEVYAWRDIPKAHVKMWKNEHRPGNMAVLVSAPRTGLRTFDDAI